MVFTEVPQSSSTQNTSKIRSYVDVKQKMNKFIFNVKQLKMNKFTFGAK